MSDAYFKIKDLIDRLTLDEVVIVNHIFNLGADRRQKRWCECGWWQKQMQMRNTLQPYGAPRLVTATFVQAK